MVSTKRPKQRRASVVSCPAAGAIVLAATLVTLLAAGCSSPAGIGRAPAPAGIPPAKELAPASSDATYDYRVTNDECNCREYAVHDASARIEYRFRATYKMQDGILTDILCTITNQSDDTLTFDRSSIKVSSINVHYQYNNKFLPLPWDPILPRSADTRRLTGKEVTTESNWHKIAGERLTVTLKGLSLGARELKSQTVVFVPENPNISK